MKKKLISALASMYIVLCALVGSALLVVIVADGDKNWFLYALAGIMIISSAVTLVWLIMYSHDRAIRTRAVIGLCSIISLVPAAYVMLLLLAVLIRACRGDVETNDPYTDVPLHDACFQFESNFKNSANGIANYLPLL